jgi:hypothetical protein
MVRAHGLVGVVAVVVACGSSGDDAVVDSAPGTVDTAPPGADSPPLPALVFSTTFDCADWDQTLGLGDADVCAAGDGIAGYGGWTTSNGSVDRITAAANYAGGGGGKGFRHWRGDGTNNNGGALAISLPSPVTEMWVRMHMRYSLGFQWTFAPDAHPHYTKDHYWNAGGAGVLIFGYQGGAWGIFDGGTAHPSTLDWYTSQGNSYTGDGEFHHYEYHVTQNGAAGQIQIWVDGVQVLDKPGVNLGSTPWTYFALGENQNEPTGAGANDYYTDYDDVAISTAGYIGPATPP